MFTITKENFIKLLNILENVYSVFVPVKKQDKIYYKKFNNDIDNMIIGEVRAFDPAKAFFFKGREKVAEGLNESMPKNKNKPFCIVGVKACDLNSFKIQDFVFLDHDYRDPFYINNRENNLIISADCTDAIETCFCIALDAKPYPENNFDINLIEMKEYYAVETGSKKGEKIINENISLFNDSAVDLNEDIKKQRQSVIDKVKKNIRANDIPMQDKYKGVVEKRFESKIWADEAKTCVECGACNTVCPTCHCFLLYDQKDKNKIERLRIWDSCLIKDFARVAGGANPREKLWMRLRNRFEKKFDYFPKVSGFYACTGCGRCILCCPAKIDIRKVLKRLVQNV